MSDTVRYNTVSMSFTASGGPSIWDYTLDLTASTAGNYPLTVSNVYGTGTTNIERVSIPTISSVTPAAATVTAGTVVVINGTNFYTPVGETIVKFGTASLAGYTVNPTSITNVVLPGAPTAFYDITVTNKLTGTVVSSSAIHVVPTPTMSNITGSANNIVGGTIYVLGTGFLTTAGYTTLQVGPNMATITTISTTQITATVPPRSPGAVDVTVANRAVSSAVSASGFTYLSASAPAITSTSTGTISTLGTNVGITGTDFLGGGIETVKLDSTICSVVSTGTNTILATMPAHAAGTGLITVMNVYGTSSGYPIEYVSIPTIVSRTVLGHPSWFASPNVATQITSILDITGTNFLTSAPTSTFTVGGSLYNPSTLTSTTARLTLPSGLSVGAKTLVVSNRGVTGADATLVSAVTVAVATSPNVSSVSPTKVAANSSNTYTIYSSYLNGAETLTLAGAGQTIVTRAAGYVTFTANIGAAGNKAVQLTNVYGVGTALNIEAVTVPTISSVSSDLGGPFGGSDTTTTFAITGTGFLNNTDTVVTMGGASGLSYNVTSTTNINCQYTTCTAGTQTITVTNKATSGCVATISFSVIQTPHITATNQSYYYTGGFGSSLWANLNVAYGQFGYVTLGGTWSGVLFNGSGVSLTVYSGATYYFAVPKLAAGTYIVKAYNTVGPYTIYSPETTTFTLVNAAAPTMTANGTSPSNTTSYGINSTRTINSGYIGATATAGLKPFTWTVTPLAGTDFGTKYAASHAGDSTNSAYRTQAISDTATTTYNQTVTHTGSYTVSGMTADDRSANLSIEFRTGFTGVAASAPSVSLSSYAPSFFYDSETNISTSDTVYAYTMGGVGPFTYQWSKVSGDTLTVSRSTSQNTEFSKLMSSSPYTGVYRCAVTDTATGLIGYSPSCTITLTR